MSGGTAGRRLRGADLDDLAGRQRITTAHRVSPPNQDTADVLELWLDVFASGDDCSFVADQANA